MALYWIVSCQLENVIWRTDRQLTSISNFLGTLLGGWDYVGVEYVLFSFTYSLINVADGISIWILESVFYPELFQRNICWILYSLISMRPIYYFDTWAIIWYGIVCWFMVFPPFLTVLVCCDHKIVLHWYENQNKNNLVIMLHKSL